MDHQQIVSRSDRAVFRQQVILPSKSNGAAPAPRPPGQKAPAKRARPFLEPPYQVEVSITG